MKSWQIILTGFLPYVMAVIVFIAVAIPYANEAITFGTAVTIIVYVLPIYFFVVIPWYYVLYIMRKRYSKRALLFTSLVFCVLQPIIFGMILKVPIGSADFLFFVSPPFIVGIMVSTLCINWFYKEDLQQLTDGRGEPIGIDD
ncbi:ATPase [Solibacillus merdavium]|uniref:ATPase n=1 Tax=Solibacillus merdavium TaxID=2762218 RepID=A0ABR8XSL1_9BACL|nr:ATPase [Solibacillus merdavium]MBD8034938.1 ATPase [Solibacillus merdavium]